MRSPIAGAMPTKKVRYLVDIISFWIEESLKSNLFRLKAN
jgi:hypothetical protein